MRSGWLFLLYCCAWPAAAQQVYKCVDGQAVVYQSAPCPGHEQRAWDATPRPFDADKAAQVEAARQQLDAASAARAAAVEPAAATVAGRPGVSTDEPYDRCEAARRSRDRVLHAAGVTQSVELTRRLDAEVYTACR